MLTISTAMHSQSNIHDNIRSSRQAVETDPQNPNLRASLGHLLFRAGDLSGAEKSFRQAIELDPARAAFHAALSHLLVRDERFGEALVEVRRALDLEPDHVVNLIHLANILARIGEIREAEQVFQRALELEPSATVHVARSRFFVDQGRVEEAITAIERAIELAPRNADSWDHYGRLLARKGMLSQADAAIRQGALLRSTDSPLGGLRSDQERNT